MGGPLLEQRVDPLLVQAPRGEDLASVCPASSSRRGQRAEVSRVQPDPAERSALAPQLVTDPDGPADPLQRVVGFHEEDGSSG